MLGEKIESTFSNVNIRRIDSVGPQVGNQLKRNGALGCVLQSFIDFNLCGFKRFDYNFAPGAVAVPLS